MDTANHVYVGKPTKLIVTSNHCDLHWIANINLLQLGFQKWLVHSFDHLPPQQFAEVLETTTLPQATLHLFRGFNFYWLIYYSGIGLNHGGFKINLYKLQPSEWPS